MVTLYGNGFIGSKYAQLYPCIVNSRDDFTPKTDELLYFVSTTDNYNVFSNPFLDIDTNLTLLVKTLEQCKTNTNTVFNFASSWFVYGQTENNAIEESYCKPKGFYSITKHCAEQLLVSYCETFNLGYRIFRFSNVVGSGDKKISHKKNALSYLIQKLVNHEDISLYDGGNFYRDYIHVEDVCHAINMILNEKINQVINIGTGKPVLFLDIINYVIKKVGSKSNISSINQPQFHKVVQNKSFYMNCDKLYNYGFKPRFNLYEIIDELIEEAKEHEKISH